jgi:WD40 repeat protein
MPAPSPRRNIKANNSKNNNSNNYSNSNSNSNNNTKNNNKKDNPVVASLPVPANDANSATQPQHPFSSIAVSPDKEYAVMARKDTLLIVNVGPAGILPFRTVPVAQHFQTNVASTGTNADSRAASADPMGRIYGDVRDTFSPAFGILGQRTGATQASSNGANVILTDVAWSTGTGSPQQPAPRQTYPAEKKNKNNKNKNIKNKNNKNKNDTSLIAAAGSNGAIVVWSAETLLQTAESGRFPAPDALLNKHVRAVNRLAWHPRRPGLLLSASQDGTVLLWERLRKVANTAATGNNGRDSIKSATTTKQGWFGKMSAQVKDPNKERSYSWHCRATFEPKSEAVRDIRWSPFYDDGTFVWSVLSCTILY